MSWTSMSRGTYSSVGMRRSVFPNDLGRTEAVHLALAYLVLTAAIAILSLQLSFFRPYRLTAATIIPIVGWAAGTTLTGFVAHEMAHRQAARHRGYWAEFRMSPMGLMLALITSFLGFLFALPGATMLGPMEDRKDLGWTSLAGPMTNLVEGGAVLVVSMVLITLFHWGAIIPYLISLAFFNGWFAAFNLIPLGPLDGRKVAAWSLPIEGSMWAVSISFTVMMYLFASGLLPFPG